MPSGRKSAASADWKAAFCLPLPGSHAGSAPLPLLAPPLSPFSSTPLSLSPQTGPSHGASRPPLTSTPEPPPPVCSSFHPHPFFSCFLNKAPPSPTPFSPLSPSPFLASPGSTLNHPPSSSSSSSSTSASSCHLNLHSKERTSLLFSLEMGVGVGGRTQLPSREGSSLQQYQESKTNHKNTPTPPPNLLSTALEKRTVLFSSEIII